MASPSPQLPSLEVIALALAIAGLAQPWFIELWRKYGVFGSIQSYPTSSLQLMYDALGPAIVGRLTLRARNKDYFVTGITATVTRIADGAQHDLVWRYCLPADPTGQPEEALSFALPQSKDHPMAAVFVDERTRVAIGEQSSRLRDALNAFLRERLGDREYTGVPTDELESLYMEFRSTPLSLDVNGRLQRLCYWEAGDYAIALTVRTSRPDKRFTTTRRFSVPDSISQGLIRNAAGLSRLAEGEESPYFAVFDVELDQ